MELSESLKKFIREHASDDLDKLLLSASRFPDINMSMAVDQIAARRQVKDKLPYWYSHEDILYPSRLSAEQCSSESSARYKQRLLKGTSCCDLTGGLGVDSYYFSLKADRHTYIERFPSYCEAARHNFQVLKAGNIQVVQGDVRDNLQTLYADTFYIDPARRADCNKRVFALSDCEPDVLQLKSVLLEHADRVIIKISPMADIEETLRLLPETIEVHVVAVRNECKELLFVLEGKQTRQGISEVTIYTANLFPDEQQNQYFSFTLYEEKECTLQIAGQLSEYLYEANAAVMKSGAFKLLASRYGMYKLHRHSHLYTADTLRHDFPGRKFKIEQVYEFSSHFQKQIGKNVPQANIAVRNFPLSVAVFRKRTHISEGGDKYLFATTLDDERKVVIQTVKAYE